jgi:hypothetical protein
MLMVTMCKCTGCPEGGRENWGYHDEKEQQLSNGMEREKARRGIAALYMVTACVGTAFKVSLASWS